MANTQCAGSNSNLSNKKCSTDYGQLVNIWIDPTDTGLSVTTAALVTNWDTKKNYDTDERTFIFPFPDDVIMEPNDPQFAESNLPGTKYVRDGQLTIQLHYEKISKCALRKLKTFHNQTWYAYGITINEDIIASSNDAGTTLVPNKCKIFVNERLAENKDDSNKCIVRVVFQETEDLWDYVVTPTDFDPTSYEGIVDFDMTQYGTLSAIAFYVDFTRDCDDTELTPEFVAADFTTSAGSITSIVWVGNRATFSGTTFASGVVLTHDGQPDATTAGYEASAALTLASSV